MGSSQPINSSLSEVGDHLLLRRIASGSYGEVWLARNHFGALRAVKIVRRDTFDSEADFQREFRGLQRFEPVSRAHRGLVDILTLGMLPKDAGIYCVMELADDQENVQPGSTPLSGLRGLAREAFNDEKYRPATLGAKMKCADALTAQDVIVIGVSLSSALEYLHCQGLVHRDVKPSNILFVGGEPKLADAGLVAALSDARSLVGTIGYIAPEGPGTPQADVYALGKVLYEAAFGRLRHEFPALSPDIQARPDHSALLELNEVIAKACAPNVRDRYASAAEMHTDLELLERGASVKARRRRSRWIRCANHVLARVGLVAIIATAVVPGTLPSKRVASTEMSTNQEANDAYWQGVWTFHQNSSNSFSESARLFALAVQKDPTFARANARLARSYIWQAPNNPEMLSRARPFAERALALAPESDEAHTAMASIQTLLDHDWVGAEGHHLKAISLNGDGPYAEDNLYGYASFLCIVGRTKEAVAQVEKALALGSRSLVWMQNAAFVFLSDRQYDRGIKIVETIVQQQPSSRKRLATAFLLPAYRAKGDFDSALRIEEENDAARGAALRTAYQQGHEPGYWQKHLEFSKDFPTNHVWMSILHVHTGDDEAALADLEAAADVAPTQLAFYINREPSFDSLRSHARFQSVRRKLGFK